MAKRSNLGYGSHILWVYRDEGEYETILKELVKDGLSKGERIILIGSEEDISKIAYLAGIKDKNISYLIPEKDIDELIEKTSERFFKSWYTRIISAIDETEEKTLKELLETSAKIDNLCKGNIVWICAYDINRLNPMSLLHLIQAHPYLMLGEEVLENFIFVPQDKLISGTATEILSLIVDILKRGEHYKSDLKDTLDLYKALFESTGTATVIIEDTTITSVNEAFVSLTGYTREEVENKMTWMEFIPLQEDLERMLRYRELRLKDPSLAPRSYETRIRDKSGNIIDVILTVNTVPGTKKFVASLADITEIKRISRALRVLSLANQELVRAKEEKELVEEIISILKSCEDYQNVKIEIEDSKVRIILDREISKAERDILDELSKDIEYGINTLRTRDKLEYSEERYRNIFENVPIALFEVDTSEITLYLRELLDSGIKDLGAYFSSQSEELDKVLELFRILDVNKSGLELCGAKNKEELEKNICRIIPKSARKDYIGIILSLLEGLQKGEIFTYLYTLSGEERQVYLKWFTHPPPPRGMSSNYRVVIVILDITETKRLTETLKKNLEELKRSLQETVELLSSIVEIKDPYTSGHQKKVSELSCKIAEKLGLSSNDIERMRIAGLLHDIGKIAIPGEILNKPAKLGELEFEIVKTHPQIGYDIIRKVNSLSDIAEIILQHHERLDGSGYPKGLKGNEILLPARILAVADVVEAMTSHRPYRPAFSLEDVIKELKENSGKLYDPQVVSACLDVVREYYQQ